MRVLLDTSILVAALIETHTFHELAFNWLEKAKDKSYEGVISAHSLAELYAILTRLPVQPTISPKEAQQLIKASVIDVFEIVPLLPRDYDSVIEHLANLRIIGGAVYDGLIMYAAFKVDVDLIVTLNEKDFRRVYPELATKVVPPEFKQPAD
jgi:predicted nucleic acid-binding protein